MLWHSPKIKTDSNEKKSKKTEGIKKHCRCVNTIIVVAAAACLTSSGNPSAESRAAAASLKAPHSSLDNMLLMNSVPIIDRWDTHTSIDRGKRSWGGEGRGSKNNKLR